jgi:hypothetical protein
VSCVCRCRLCRQRECIRTTNQWKGESRSTDAVLMAYSYNYSNWLSEEAEQPIREPEAYLQLSLNKLLCLCIMWRPGALGNRHLHRKDKSRKGCNGMWTQPRTQCSEAAAHGVYKSCLILLAWVSAALWQGSCQPVTACHSLHQLSFAACSKPALMAPTRLASLPRRVLWQLQPMQVRR